MTRTVRLLLAVLWLVGAGSRADASTAAENRAFKEARSAFEDTIWERAERLFAGFVQKYPDSTLAVEAVLYRAQALFKLRRFADAIPLLEERKANAGSQTDRYLYWIGEARLQSRDYGAAAAAFAELTRDYPASAYRFEASLGEAEARAGMGDWPKVSELLGNPTGTFFQTATNQPGNAQVIRGWFLFAQAGLEQKDAKEAQAALRSLDAVVLNAEQTWQRQQLLVRIALNANQMEEAERQSTNLVLLAGLTARPEFTAESWALRGQICERLGQVTKAIEAYSQNLNPGAPIERQREALGKLAELHLARGEMDEAMRKLVAFLNSSSNTAAADVALLTLAELHLKQQVAGDAATNHLDQALGLLDRLMAQPGSNPLLGRAQLNRGWCYWLSNQPAMSRTAFSEAATRLAPSESLAVAQFKVGDTALLLKDFSAAREAYRAALATAAKFPAAAELEVSAWYQLERACLALGDMAGAEAAMRQILQHGPDHPLAERSLLLSAQGYAEAKQPEAAAPLFAEFVRQFPDSTLRPEVELAAARVAEQQADWPGAVARYESWSARFTNHVLLPDVEFYRARAAANAWEDTNAFGLFTNYLARFPTNALVPAAEYWIGDYFFRQGNFPEAEKHFSLLYHYWPGSELAAEACMMAGRAAEGWSSYRNAINHFTNLTLNPNCPLGLKAPALFAYGSALRLQPESNPTNRLANLLLAVGVFNVIQAENPGTAIAAEAWGEIGNTYFQSGALDAKYYPEASNAYQQAFSLPAASAATRGLAKVGSGLVAERMAAGEADPRAVALRSAFEHYVDVLHDEAGDPFARKKAGLEAVRVGRALGEWSQVEAVCIRMQKLFPPLHASLERHRIEAGEKARAEKKLRTDEEKN